jgi:FHA domain
VSQPWRYSLRIRGRDVNVPEGEVTVGRSRSATISLQDPSISRIHIRVVAREGRVSLEDLGSVNGTYVNGLRVEGVVEIGDGAQIMLGESELELKVEKAPSPLATRRIDIDEYICPSCRRPYPEGTQTCPSCPAPSVGPSNPSVTVPAPDAAMAEMAAMAADNEPTVHRVAKSGRSGVLPTVDLPPLPPDASAPVKPNPPRSPRPVAQRPAAGRKPGLLARLFGRG